MVAVAGFEFRWLEQLQAGRSSMVYGEVLSEAKCVAEIKELTDRIASADEEHKVAFKVLGLRIGELEADIKRTASECDATLERERIAN